MPLELRCHKLQQKNGGQGSAPMKVVLALLHLLHFLTPSWRTRKLCFGPTGTFHVPYALEL
jgi:hypothetical protein